jgi:dolichol-phosphate mannosyltransferase
LAPGVDLLLLWLGWSLSQNWTEAHLLGLAGRFVVAAPIFFSRIIATIRNNWATLVRLAGFYCLFTLLALFLRGGIVGTIAAHPYPNPLPALLFMVGVTEFCYWIGLAILRRIKANHKVNHRLWRHLLPLSVVGYAVVLRLFYIGSIELLHEEAYYWNFAQHLDIGYLDHPPMVAWIIYLFDEFWHASEFSTRLGAWLCWLVAAGYLFALTRRRFGIDSAWATVVLLALLPAYFVTGMLMTPEAPLVACWSAALYYSNRALIDKSGAAWLGVGIGLGLGLLSKYTMALFGLGLLTFMLADREARQWFKRPEPYLSASITLLLFTPVIWWNAAHNWESFYYQGPARLMGNFDFDLPDLMGAAIILLTPLGFWQAIKLMALKASTVMPVARTCQAERDLRLAVTLTGVALAIFLSFSLFRNIKLNWTIPIWLGLLPYIGQGVVKNLSPIAFSPTWVVNLALLLMIYGASFHLLAIGFPGIPLPANILGSGWRSLGEQIENLVSQHEAYTGRRPIVVGMDTDRAASWAAFYRSRARRQNGDRQAVAETIGRHLFYGDAGMYRYWHPIPCRKAPPMLLVEVHRNQLTDYYLRNRVVKAGPIHKLLALRNQAVIGHCYYRWVNGYRNHPNCLTLRE